MICKSALMIFALASLSFEGSAQYMRMTRGDVSRYDSSVNIELSEYRRIRQKVTLADSLAANINLLISQSNDLRTEFNDKEKTLLSIVKANGETIDRKDETIKGLSSKFDDLESTAKKFRIFNNPIADIGAKILVGAALGILIIK